MRDFNRKGFTLIEILIVVAIIAILASIVLVGLGPSQQAGRDARRLSDLREVQTGLELYYNQCGFYPGGKQATAPCPNAWVEVKTWGGLTTALTGTPGIAVNSVPNDPSSNATYYYDSANNGSTYLIAAKLENVGNSVFTNYTPPALSNGPNAIPAADTCGSGGFYCLSL